MKLQDLVHARMQERASNPLESRAKIGHYPSAASLILEIPLDDGRVFKKLIGNCMRAEYYKWNNYEALGETQPAGFRRMSYGKFVERSEVNTYKELGIYHSSNVKFIHKYGELQYPVSGEIDAAIYSESRDKLIGVELKSVHEYFGRKGCIISTRDTSLFPKDNHILQVLIYLSHYTSDQVKLPIDLFKLVYIDRGNGMDNEHDLEISPAGNLIVTNDDVKRIEYPQYNIHKIIDRFKQLETHLINDTLPPKDCKEQYSKEELEDLMILGDLSKTHIAELKAGRTPKKGDWQCSYCNFRAACAEDKK